MGGKDKAFDEVPEPEDVTIDVDAEGEDPEVIEFDDFWSKAAGGGGASGGGRTSYFSHYAGYDKATADRVPVLSQEIRESGKAVQVEVKRVAPGGQLEECGKLPMDFAIEDAIDLVGQGGTYRFQPLDLQGQPVGEWVPKRVSARHPYLLEVEEQFRRGGGPSLDIDTVMERMDRARQEGRQDSISIMKLHSDDADRLRAHELKILQRTDELNKGMSQREDSIALERAKLVAAASRDYSQSQSQMFQALMDGQKESSDRMMAMLLMMNNQKSPIDKLLELLMSPVGIMLVKELWGGRRPEKDPMEQLMQMVTLMNTISPRQEPQTLAGQLEQLKTLQALTGGEGKSDTVQLAELAASTVGDLAATFRPQPQLPGPTKPQPKTKPMKPKAPSVSGPARPAGVSQDDQMNAVRAVVAIDAEPDATVGRAVDLVFDQWGGKKPPAGMDLAAEMKAAGLPAARAEAIAKAVNEKE